MELLKELVNKFREKKQTANGLIESGNIDVTKRPKVKNPDGTISTVRTITIGTDKGFVNIPTVVNDRVISESEAVEHFKKTKQHLGIYGSLEQALEAAKSLHEQQQEMYSPKEQR